MAKISVIIPIYNMEKHLENCIDSVLKQTLKDIEVILINDGSTDNSLSICNSYKKMDKRIKVINKCNSGVSSARNDGIKNSLGKYVTFIDSDDWIEKDMLQSLYEQAERNNCDMCLCNYILQFKDRSENIELEVGKSNIIEKEILTDLILPFVGPEKVGENFNIAGFRSPWGKLYKRSIIEENNIRFDDKLSIGEDVIFNLEFLANSKKVSHVRDFFYHYIQHEDSILNRYKVNYWDICNSYINKIENFLYKKELILLSEQRLCIEKLNSIILCIRNECSRQNRKKLYEKIRFINLICSSNLAKDIYEGLDLNKLSILHRIRLELINHRMALILYIYYKIELFKLCIIK